MQRWVPTGEDRGVLALGVGVVLGGPIISLGAILSMGVDRVADGEVEELHW